MVFGEARDVPGNGKTDGSGRFCAFEADAGGVVSKIWRVFLPLFPEANLGSLPRSTSLPVLARNDAKLGRIPGMKKKGATAAPA